MAIIAEFMVLDPYYPWLFSSWKEITVVLAATKEGWDKNAAGLGHFLLDVMEYLASNAVRGDTLISLIRSSPLNVQLVNFHPICRLIPYLLSI